MEKWCDVCSTKTKDWRYIKDSSYVICDKCSEDLEVALITLIESRKEKEEELMYLYEENDRLYTAYQRAEEKKKRYAYENQELRNKCGYW